jgi:phosphoglycolate phosphatase-like HAD superfamily hydrolase
MGDWFETLLSIDNPRDFPIEQATSTGIDRYARLRAHAKAYAVAQIAPSLRKNVLESVYGDWRLPGALPDPQSAYIKQILKEFMPGKHQNSIIIEEYRRLDSCIPGRKLYCLDLEGVIIDNHEVIPGILDTISELRREHGVVVSTAVPQAEAEEMITQYGLTTLLPAVFGDLGDLRGKKYSPIAMHYGFGSPENKLVAVGHEQADLPVDLEIPFILVTDPTCLLSEILTYQA